MKRGLILPIITFILLISILFLVSAEISSISLSSPANNSVTGDTTPDFTFTPLSNINTSFSCELFIDDVGYGVNSTVQNNTLTTLTANATLTEGSKEWYVNCTDVNGTNQSNIQTLTIDTSNPTITIDYPAADGWYNADFTVNVTATANTVKYRYENSSENSSWISLENLTASAWNVTFNSSIGDGNFTIRINATDEAGNDNTTETVFIWLDTTNPTIDSFTLSDTSVSERVTITGSCAASDNLDSAVSTSVTGIDTSSPGTYTATCTATDEAGNTATSSLDYSVSSSGGSSSDDEDESEKYIKSFDRIEAEEKETINPSSATRDETGVKEISLTTEIDFLDVRFTIQEEDEDDMEQELDNSYKYFSITATNLDDDYITNAEIEFEVDKDWIEDNDYDGNSIVLNRYNDEWQALETELTDEDSDVYTYTATTPGFSDFAVTAGEAVIVETDTETIQEVSDTTDIEETIEQAEQAKKSLLKKWWFWTILVIAAIAVVFYVMIPRGHRRFHPRAKHPLKAFDF
jgi:PGF-pre-PGF domain-containing protein